jgi:DNA-binding MarR family transcriptional regulator
VTGAVRRIRRFNRFYTAFLGVLDRHFLESPYSLTEVRVLYEICHGSESLARDIGESLGVDRGYLSRIIDSFIRSGLVRASPSARDRRQHIIRLTQKGKAVFGALEARSEKSISRAIDALSPGQQEELVGHMERIQELLARRTEK